MKDVLSQVKNSVKGAAKKSTQAVSDVLEHEDTQAAVDWAKKAAITAADEAVRLGKEVVRSDMAKDAAAGAAIGAALSVPLPIIGPAAGAVVGAGVGIYKNITTPVTKRAEPALPNAQKADIYEQLTKLDELKTKGILTEAEFEEQKKRILKNT